MHTIVYDGHAPYAVEGRIYETRQTAQKLTLFRTR